MGVCRAALTWIRKNMIRFPNTVMVYRPRNTTKSSIWSWGSLVKPKSSNSIPWLRFAPSIYLQGSAVWKEETTVDEVEHLGALPAFSSAEDRLLKIGLTEEVWFCRWNSIIEKVFPTWLVG